METISSTKAKTLTDRELRDAMLHHTYVISTLLVEGLDTKAKERLDTFRALRDETRRRHE